MIPLIDNSRVDSVPGEQNIAETKRGEQGRPRRMRGYKLCPGCSTFIPSRLVVCKVCAFAFEPTKAKQKSRLSNTATMKQISMALRTRPILSPEEKQEFDNKRLTRNALKEVRHGKSMDAEESQMPEGVIARDVSNPITLNNEQDLNNDETPIENENKGSSFDKNDTVSLPPSAPNLDANFETPRSEGMTYPQVPGKGLKTCPKCKSVCRSCSKMCKTCNYLYGGSNSDVTTRKAPISSIEPQDMETVVVSAKAITNATGAPARLSSCDPAAAPSDLIVQTTMEKSSDSDGDSLHDEISIRQNDRSAKRPMRKPNASLKRKKISQVANESSNDEDFPYEEGAYWKRKYLDDSKDREEQRAERELRWKCLKFERTKWFEELKLRRDELELRKSQMDMDQEQRRHDREVLMKLVEALTQKRS